MMNNPIILTLDAGGTNFSFSAIQDGNVIEGPVSLPAQAHDLDLCLQNLKDGFHQLMAKLDKKPSAISFAFPGPADYKNGVIGDLPNLPAFRGGIPLGPILEDEFQIPVYINNDGDLFTYGESKAGFLPWINQELRKTGNSKQYKNLIGITLGTGFGVGISINGMLLEGDNSAAAEGWKFRNKRHPYSFVEDTISIQALKRMYAEQIAMDPAKAPEPFQIYQIAKGEADGIQQAARESFMRYGEVLGDAIAHLITIIDGLVVIGGGIAGAYPMFSGAMFDELRSQFNLLNGTKTPRIIQEIYDVEKKRELELFLTSESKKMEVPGHARMVTYLEKKKSALGLSRLGTSGAITQGAYFYALSQLTK